MAADTVIRVQEVIVNADEIIGITLGWVTKETYIIIWVIREAVIRTVKVGEWGIRVFREVETERWDKRGKEEYIVSDKVERVAEGRDIKEKGLIRLLKKINYLIKRLMIFQNETFEKDNEH